MKDLIVSDIKTKIYTIRGIQVMLDSDLAELYGVSTKRLNEQVKRNIERFPERFMFQITSEEETVLRSQNATTSHGGRRYMPYVFTEQGVSMLACVLKSNTAVKVSIKIIDAFVSMRHFISQNSSFFKRLDSVEKKQISFEVETDKKFDEVFKALETHEPKQKIFFDGEIFDSYEFVCHLVKKAKRKIILIDNYVDESVLTLFSKRKKGVSVYIYSKKISKQLKLDVEKFNSQYERVMIKEFDKSHDRFLLIDDEIYHFGASLKDLGKKWFAFSKFEKEAIEMLSKLDEDVKNE